MIRNQTSLGKWAAVASAAGILAMLAVPASSQIQGPISGVVYDSASRELRPIIGVPGSSYLGGAVFQDVDAAVVSPDGKCALVTRQGEQALVCGLLSGQPGPVPVDGMIGNVDLVAWNRKADTVAILSTKQMLLQWVHVRGVSAVSQFPVDLAPLGGIPATLALSSTGETAAVGMEGGLYKVSESGAPALAARLDQPAAAVFGTSADTIYVLERSAREIRIIRPDSTSEAIPLADPDAPDPAPVGLAVSEDRDRIWVALAREAAVRSYSIATGELQSQESLDITPACLLRVSDSLYSLHKAGNAPLLLLRTGDPAGVFFVPAGVR